MAGASRSMGRRTLFISGAGLPAWIWDDVRETFPGETRVAPLPAPDSSLTQYAEAVLAHVEDWSGFDVVAHSIGGVVAAALAAVAAPGRVTGLVAVAASVPAPGQSFVGALPFPQRHGMSLVVRLLGTRPPEKALRSGLLGGVDPDRADRLVAEFTPAPKALFLDRTPAGSAVPDATYVLTTRDAELPADLQETYAARLGGDVVRIDTGHLPMLEAPGALAQVLCDRLAASRGS